MPELYYPFPLSTVTEWPGQRPGSYHVGTDFGIAQSSTLKATANGTISRWTDQYGAYIVDIRTDDGWIVRNGHLSRIDVQNGQRVTIGQSIGLTGGIPGTLGAGWSTGAHLHWELRNNTAWVDPRTLNPQPKQFGDIALSKGSQVMYLIHETNGRVAHIVTENGSSTIPSEHHQNLWKKILNSSASNPAIMEPSEVAYIDQTLRAIARANAGTFNGTVTAEVDYQRIAKTVLDEEARRLTS